MYFQNRVSAALVPRKNYDLDTLTSFDFHALQIFEEVHKKVAKFPYHNTNLLNTQKNVFCEGKYASSKITDNMENNFSQENVTPCEKVKILKRV